MARTIDYTRLNEDDFNYLSTRQWLVEEGDFQGHETSKALQAWRDGEAVEANEDDDEGIEYKDATVDDLRAELKSRDLPTDGKKAELIARLEADDLEHEDEEDEEDDEEDDESPES